MLRLNVNFYNREYLKKNKAVNLDAAFLDVLMSLYMFHAQLTANIYKTEGLVRL